jgi:hypothetical protein
VEAGVGIVQNRDTHGDNFHRLKNDSPKWSEGRPHNRPI